MTPCVALLRAVNVAGHNTVAMADLRDILADLGLGNPRSYIQSGNLLFTADGRALAALEGILEQAAATRLALETDFFVRTADEWAALIAANPFKEQAGADPGHLVAMFLKQAPPESAVEALRGRIALREEVCAVGRSLYVVYPNGIGRSRLTAKLIESALGTKGTGRNWNTVLRLQAMLQV